MNGQGAPERTLTNGEQIAACPGGMHESFNFATTANAASTPDKARRAVPASALIAMIVPIPIRNRDAQSTESDVCSTCVKRL